MIDSSRVLGREEYHGKHIETLVISHVAWSGSIMIYIFPRELAHSHVMSNDDESKGKDAGPGSCTTISCLSVRYSQRCDACFETHLIILPQLVHFVSLPSSFSLQISTQLGLI